MQGISKICPSTKALLSRASVELRTAVNSKISERRLTDNSGQIVDTQLDDLLIDAASKIGYPVRSGIPQILIPLGIPLDQLSQVKSVE